MPEATIENLIEQFQVDRDRITQLDNDALAVLETAAEHWIAVASTVHLLPLSLRTIVGERVKAATDPDTYSWRHLRVAAEGAFAAVTVERDRRSARVRTQEERVFDALDVLVPAGFIPGIITALAAEGLLR